MDRNTRVILGFLIVGAMVAVPYLGGALYVPPPPPPPAAPIVETPTQTIQHLAINAGDTLDEILAGAGLEPATRLDLLRAFGDAFDIRKVRAGKELLLARWEKTGEIASLTYNVDPDHEVVLVRDSGVSSAEVVEISGTVKEVPVCATLNGSLDATMRSVGENFVLAMMMADILAFDIDFYRDPQPGDDFCLLVEKKFYDNGQPPTYRRILGARYNNAGTVSDAYFFAAGSDKGAYYSADGKSLKSAFLRSPLEFDAHVSSHFSMSRLHPVLHEVRAHYGTDYAAPTGTPVRSVASGKVVAAGMSGGSGNMVTIRHSDGYQTQYLHLSRILVHAGQSVEQSTRIGLVGSTGLATGPHLDIRISRNGQYMNWEKMRSPRTESLDGSQKQNFTQQRDHMMALMNSALKPLPVSSAASTLQVGQ
ncbi:MAG: peptidoglycan DD-metalloendopeptidase family protein [Acidobacteriota bacterium]